MFKLVDAGDDDIHGRTLVVMISVVDSRREILLSPLGTNVWSGQMVQGLNASAITWSLAKQVYGLNGPYYIIPFGLLIGIIPTSVQWLVWKARTNTFYADCPCQSPN